MVDSLLVPSSGLIVPTQVRSPTRGMYDFPEAPSRAYDPQLFAQDEGEKDFLRDFQLGKMGIFGPEGSGKGVLLTWLAMRFKRFWPTRPLVTDFYLTDEFKQDFGDYIYMDQYIMMEQINKTEEMAAQVGKQLSKEEKEEWLADGKAGIVLRNAILLLDEFDNWANKYRCSSKVNEMIMGLFSRFRHFKMLVVGACPKKSKLNPDVQDDFMYEIYCRPHGKFPDRFDYTWFTISGMGPMGRKEVARTDTSEIYGRPVYPYFWTDAPVSVISKNRPKSKKIVSKTS